MRIYADSASDLPKAFFDKNDVTLIPLHVLIDGKEYEDIVEIDSREVYKTIRNGGQPKTSQVSPEELLERWTELSNSGEEGIYIAFSSELSGTYNTAVMMRDQVKEENKDLNLLILDSKCASLGYGLLIK
ncbi:DegV family EDD domain-containing protein, partial [Microvirga sp. 3-52]|nr:DegV family EDD domain-containing protein [Microvirga sp. 3-52]